MTWDSKRTLLVVDSLLWAWGHMARGIQKFAPPDYSVEICDQTDFSKLAKRDIASLAEYDGVCHFSWSEAPLPTAITKLPIKRLTTLVASMGFDFNFPVEDERDIPSTIATALRNRREALKKFNSFDGILCVSKRCREKALHFTRKAYRVFPGIDEIVFSATPIPRREKLRVGWCGQKPGVRNNTKGFREILVPLIAKLGDEVEFVVNGRDAEDALDQEQMAQWYRDIDVLISTSCSEGFQMPTLEAAASGRPLICTAVGGADELVVHEVNGFILPAWKTEADAAELVNLFIEHIRKLRDRELLQWLGDNARRSVEMEYTWARRAPEWLKLIGG